MPTTKLNLPTITGNMSADVVRDLNALANAIDGKVGVTSGIASLGTDGKIPSGQLPAMDYVPTSQKGVANGVATLGADGKVPASQLNVSSTADKITITDAGNKFVSSNVEGALEELFTFANDGKTYVANAVTAKGVSASPSDTFATLATKIGQISTGKRWANGTVTSGGNLVFQYAATTGTISIPHVIVTGLTFKPKTIVIRGESGSARYVTIYDEFDSHYPKTVKVFQVDGDNFTGNNYNFKADASNANVSLVGFTLPVPQPSIIYTWEAYE